MLPGEYQLELTRPIYLASLLALGWVAYCYFWSLVDLERWQRLLSLTIRVLILGLLGLALAGLNLLRPTDRQFVIVAWDRSLSVDDQSHERLQEFLGTIADADADHATMYLPFAVQPGEVTDTFVEEDDDRDRMGTDLAAAIETAAAALPPFYVPQIFLITDGNQTQGDAVSASLATDVPVHTVPLPTRSAAEVQVSEVAVPTEVRRGEPFYVDVIINSNHDDEGRIEIYRGDVKIDAPQAAATYKITKGENHFRFRQEITDQRLVNYTARISEFDDQLLDNNMASGLVSAAGMPRALLVDSDTTTTDHLRWALEEQDIRVDVRPPESLPGSLSDLQNYEVVILSNVPATSLSVGQMEVMRSYVQDLGGGLVMIGGDQSFGLGGYYKTTLEEILPVRSDFEKEKEKPSLAMVFVIDRSGSMTGEKIELAKEAAKSAVDLLGPRDQVGVIAFDSTSYWVNELRSASDKSYVSERISTIEAGGGTSIEPGMIDAYQALSSAVAKLKHVVLLTDGHSAPGDFEGITADMAANRITVSTVGVGQGTDTDLLEQIAQQGNGRYYYCDDPASIPQIFAKETVMASKSAIHEQPFLPQLMRPTPVLNSLDIESAPFLLGFVATRPKPTSELVLATETGEPLLAWWRYGLGTTAAFTSDAKERWAAEWLTWPDFSTFWAQVIRKCMRKNDAKGVYVEVERHGSQTEIRLDSVDGDGRFRNDTETQVTVVGPKIGSGKKEVKMEQVAPGRYVARVDTEDEGAYHFDLSQTVGGRTIFRQTRGLVVGYPDELRLNPTDEKLLRQIAALSGGHFTTRPDEVLENETRTVHRAEPLWPYLLTAAMLLFVADVALRRVDLAQLGIGPAARA